MKLQIRGEGREKRRGREWYNTKRLEKRGKRKKARKPQKKLTQCHSVAEASRNVEMHCQDPPNVRESNKTKNLLSVEEKIRQD